MNDLPPHVIFISMMIDCELTRPGRKGTQALLSVLSATVRQSYLGLQTCVVTI